MCYIYPSINAKHFECPYTLELVYPVSKNLLEREIQSHLMLGCEIIAESSSLQFLGTISGCLTWPQECGIICWIKLLEHILDRFPGIIQLLDPYVDVKRMRTDPVFIMKQMKIGCKPSRICKKIDQAQSTLNFTLQEIIANWIDEL